MIEPTPSLFYDCIVETFPRNSAFATRAVSKVVVVDPKDKFCPTLCIDGKGIIRVNPQFWRKHIRTKLDAKLVFLHEMFHSVLGDTITMRGAEDKYEAALMNLSMDMRINAAIAQYLVPLYKTYSRTTNVFQSMYKPNGPEGLLRPGSSYSARNKYSLIYRALYANENSYRRASTGEEARVKDIFKNEETIRNALKQLLPRSPSNEKKLQKLIYIGNHSNEKDQEDKDYGQDSKNQETQDQRQGKQDPGERKEIEAPPIVEALEEDLKEEMRDAISSAMAAQGGTSAGFSDVFFESMIEVIESSKNVHMGALEAFACDAKINQIKAMFERERRTSSVVPLNPSNRELVMLAAGWCPTRWTNKRIDQGKKNRNIAVYLDVSGSVSSYLPKILGVIQTMRQGIKTVYCFSNEVHEHHMDELMEGKYKSTGGTDFNCVINHAIEKNLDKVIVFSDGCAYVDHEVKQKGLEQIKDAAIVYFGYKQKNNFFANNYQKQFELEELLK